MFYFNPTQIDAMVRSRLSRKGHLINLDINDYRILVAEQQSVCAVRVISEDPFPEFLDQLRQELYNAQSAVDEPVGIMMQLTATPEGKFTMENYKALHDLITEMFGSEVNMKFGFSLDDKPHGDLKDIFIIVAGD